MAPAVLVALGLVALCLGGGAALAHWRGEDGTAATASSAESAAPPPPEDPADGHPAGEPSSGADVPPRASGGTSGRTGKPGTAEHPGTAGKPGATGVTGETEKSGEAEKSGAAGTAGVGGGSGASRAPVTVPDSGAGTFTTARTAGARTGSGPLRRYRVQVEDGIDVSARRAAEEIQRILAHPRGWAAHGRGSFQLVSEDADFVIRIATPKTADALCRAQGLDTGGELNCETTDGVVVNLKRWLLGSPTFSGTPAEYRHLIINHEVGHEIGIRQHMDCPGPGRPAPVMMQQIKGLKGCVSNAWPYDTDGRYITGPVVR